MSGIEIRDTPVPGLLHLTLPLHGDSRGWFTETWQREKMTALGLPDFRPVQQNVSCNLHAGATRGIHAEPWDKYISVTSGRAFCAWVDLREGDTFGMTHHAELDPGQAVFVPRGVANAYQALEPGTVYSYLVTDHWRPGTTYPALALDDPTAAIPWPISLDTAEVSEKDRRNPRMTDIEPAKRLRTLVLGGGGQLGRALAAEFPDSVVVDQPTLDLADPLQLEGWSWTDYDVVLNAAGYTAVDRAEDVVGRADAWRVNAAGPAQLATLSTRHGFTLVHYSTDYVFDGTRDSYTEDDDLTPLGVYAQSKAAGELAAKVTPTHYVIRTSWLVGDGHNFVRTMVDLAAHGASPAVVDDQVGRLTFTPDLAAATHHLLRTHAPYGTYHCTNTGPPMSWAEVARLVFEHRARSRGDVRSVTTEEYAAGRRMAPRPGRSVLDLSRLEATGFVPRDARDALQTYLDALPTSS